MPRGADPPGTDPASAGRDGDAGRRLRAGLLAHGLRRGEGVDRLGRPLAWLLDCREAVLGTDVLPHAGRLLWRAVRRHRPDLVGGLTMAADPLTVAVLAEAARDGNPLGGFAVRRRAKRYGLRRLIEGRQVRPGSTVVLLDDVISSGLSLARAHRAVAAAGGTVVAAVVLVDYGRQRAWRFTRLGVPVESLLTLSDLGLAGRGRPSSPR